VPVRVSVRGAAGTAGIPGRSLDLGEGGIAAILAGEVRVGDPVGIEFLLPEMGLGLHTKAVVRHHADLRCGLEFFGLSLEQQAMIRRWTRRMLEKPSADPQAVSVVPDQPNPARFQVALDPPKPAPRKRKARIALTAAAIVLAVAGVALGLYWRVEWTSLQPAADTGAAAKVERVKLDPGETELRLVHKEDAQYPDGHANGTGMVLVHIVVGTDGTVIDARPIDGPEASARAAVDAVREWRFEPYRVHGSPAEVETTVAVSFHE
jgi:TonB family protein